MHLKNNLFSLCIIPVIFFIGCSDDNQTLIISNLPPELPRPIYKLNLQSDSGVQLTTVSIQWDIIEADSFYINGNKIIELYKKYTQKGYRCVGWSAEEYPSGIYFVKILTNEYINTKKIMLIK